MPNPMRTVFHTLLFLLPAILHAQSSDSTRFALSIGAGFQHDDFRWSIAGNSQGQDPNIYSELIYKSLRGPAFSAQLRWHLSPTIAVQGSFTGSTTTGGTATDTDYAEDNRKTPIYKGNFDSDKGYTRQWQIQAGYALLRRPVCRLTAWVGYSTYNQQVYLLDNDGSSDPDLHSSYNTRWRGPVATLESRFTLSPHFFTTLSATYHQTGYRSQADWNLIEDFNHPISFQQTAKGYRAAFSLTPHFACSARVAFFLNATYTTAHTGTGVDRVYLKNGNTQETQFNGAKGTAFRIGAGITVLF